MNLRYSIDWMRHAVRFTAEDLLMRSELSLAAFEMSTVPMIFQDGRRLIDFGAVTEVGARTDDLVFFLISLNKLARAKVAVVVPSGKASDLVVEAIRAVGLRQVRFFGCEAEALEWLNEGVATDRLLAATSKQSQSLSEATE